MLHDVWDIVQGWWRLAAWTPSTVFIIQTLVVVLLVVVIVRNVVEIFRR